MDLNIIPEIKTILMAMMPIGEVRASIPFALGVYDFSAVKAMGLSVIGSLIPAFFLILSLEKTSKVLMNNSPYFQKFFNWLFERTRNRLNEKYLKYGTLALVLFVAIPLPVTGVWTASVGAYLFGIPFKKAFPCISLGALIAGVIVTLVSTGIFALF